MTAGKKTSQGAGNDQGKMAIIKNTTCAEWAVFLHFLF